MQATELATNAPTNTTSSTGASRVVAQALRAIYSLANQHDRQLAALMVLGAPAVVARAMQVFTHRRVINDHLFTSPC